MIKKYIRGNSTRGDEVIKELEKLGGVNEYGFIGNLASEFYIIDHTDGNNIKAVSRGYFKELIEQTFEEIHLPEEFTPKEFVIVTEKATNDCYGCVFKGCVFKKGIHCSAGMWFANDCKEKGIIYKLKQLKMKIN